MTVCPRKMSDGFTAISQLNANIFTYRSVPKCPGNYLISEISVKQATGQIYGDENEKDRVDRVDHCVVG